MEAPTDHWKTLINRGELRALLADLRERYLQNPSISSDFRRFIARQSRELQMELEVLLSQEGDALLATSSTLEPLIVKRDELRQAIQEARRGSLVGEAERQDRRRQEIAVLHRELASLRERLSHA
jgi:hypothetical protein